MVNQPKDIDVLIAAFLKGEATPEEALLVDEFIAASEENKRYFQQLEQLMALAHQTPVFDASKKTSTWEAIVSSTQKEEKPLKTSIFTLKRVVYAAAALVILALTLMFVLPKDSKQLLVNHPKLPQKNGFSAPLYVAKTDTSLTLTDQTKIYLKAGSKLEISSNYNKQNRSLSLKGSAEFHVIHDEKKPFVVAVEKLKIVDLGTVFRVVSSRDTVKIVVDEGKVELRLNNQVLSMAAGDSAFYVIKSDFIDRYETKKERKNKVFEFDGTSLKEVAEVLSDFYKQPIVIKDKAIENCQLTVRFSNENLITILDVIQELMDIKVVKNKQVIELYGKGCND